MCAGTGGHTWRSLSSFFLSLSLCPGSIVLLAGSGRTCKCGFGWGWGWGGEAGPRSQHRDCPMHKYGWCRRHSRCDHAVPAPQPRLPWLTAESSLQTWLRHQR